MSQESRIIGRVPFVDGVMRDVFEDPDGQHWVIGYEWERVYGVWILPPDVPLVVTPECGLVCRPVSNSPEETWPMSSLTTTRTRWAEP
jgi:hypothetical protein